MCRMLYKIAVRFSIKTKTETVQKFFIFQYLGIILHSDLSWAYQVNYTAQRAWKALHFIMHVLNKGNSNMKSLTYMSLVRPILEYRAFCWDPYKESQIHIVDCVQKKGAKFANHMRDSVWETFTQHR
jgi:hypothetical protein